MTERKSPPQLTRTFLLAHLASQGAYAGVLVLLSLGIGMAGYHWAAGYSWLDAFLNASMLLGGMGPVGELPSNGGKLFAGFFALYAGLVFLAVSVLLLTPVFHHVLHRVHWERGRDG